MGLEGCCVCLVVICCVIFGWRFEALFFVLSEFVLVCGLLFFELFYF